MDTGMHAPPYRSTADSMKKSPPSEVGNSQSSEETIRLLCNPHTSCSVYKHPPMDGMIGHLNQVYTQTSHIIKVPSNITPLSTPRLRSDHFPSSEHSHERYPHRIVFLKNIFLSDHMTQAHALTPCLYKFNFNIVLPSTSRSSKRLFPSGSMAEIFCAFFLPPMCGIYPYLYRFNHPETNAAKEHSHTNSGTHGGECKDD